MAEAASLPATAAAGRLGQGPTVSFPIMPSTAWSWMLHQNEYVPEARSSTAKSVGPLRGGTVALTAMSGPNVHSVAVQVGASGPMIMLCGPSVWLVSTKVASPAGTVIIVGMKKSLMPVVPAAHARTTGMPCDSGEGVGVVAVGSGLGEAVGAAVAVGVGTVVGDGVGDAVAVGVAPEHAATTIAASPSARTRCFKLPPP